MRLCKNDEFLLDVDGVSTIAEQIYFSLIDLERLFIMILITLRAKAEIFLTSWAILFLLFVFFFAYFVLMLIEHKS